MIRKPIYTTAHPPPVEWHPATLKAVQTATSVSQMAEAKRMGSALAGMQEKDKPTAKDIAKPRK